ncbi:CBASS cGAMP-activated phospholipase [Pseudomonas sp. R3-41]
MSSKRFQVLALSGGGYRGLYTATILAEIEREIGGPIARHFDLIAGTSIGGILALAIASEIPAQTIVNMFKQHGAAIFKPRTRVPIFESTFSSDELKKQISAPTMLGDKLLGDCLHPVVIPSINYSTGKPVLFKTPHHETFRRDHLHPMVDIALATSAAPTYFPRHQLQHSQYVDGGLFANAPGLLALHEAETFFDVASSDIHLLAIGTMSSKFTVNPKNNREGGALDWGGGNPLKAAQRLFGLSISVQESLCDFMLQHKLGSRYMHVDEDLTDDRSKAVALDKADIYAQEVLIGSGLEKAKVCLGKPDFMAFVAHKARPIQFYYGSNATSPEAEKC